MGKRGGARVIYFTRLLAGELCMLLVYPKATKDDIPAHILKQVRKELEDGSCKQAKPGTTGEVLGLKLLLSVREMKARNFARATEVPQNEVVVSTAGHWTVAS